MDKCVVLLLFNVQSVIIFALMSYNTFRGRKTDGLFVYGLTDKDVIFYIGITGFLRSRYKQHFTDTLLCSEYIYQMRMEGRYPGIVILGIFDTHQQAEIAEHSIIRCLSHLGNKLLNNHQNPHTNKLQYETKATVGRPKNMPPELLNNLIHNAIEEYNQFRQWMPFTIWKRLHLENMQQNTTQ